MNVIVINACVINIWYSGELICAQRNEMVIDVSPNDICDHYQYAYVSNA